MMIVVVFVVVAIAFVDVGRVVARSLAEVMRAVVEVFVALLMSLVPSEAVETLVEFATTRFVPSDAVAKALDVVRAFEEAVVAFDVMTLAIDVASKVEEAFVEVFVVLVKAFVLDVVAFANVITQEVAAPFPSNLQTTG